MRIIRRRWRGDITIITSDEMDHVDWSHITRGCVFLDIWGTLHLELGQKGFHVWLHNTNWYRLLFQQDQLYAALADQMIARAVCAPPEDLLGGFHFLYRRNTRILIPFNVALLTRQRVDERGVAARNPHIGDVRRHGFEQLWKMFDDIARHLGAQAALIASAPIPEDKFRAFGCVPFSPPGWRGWLMKAASFPYRHQRNYFKIYT